MPSNYEGHMSEPLTGDASRVDQRQMRRPSKPSHGQGSPLGIHITVYVRAERVTRATARRIAAEFATDLDTAARRRLVRIFLRELIPAKRPGRKRSAVVTRAHADWKAGVRGQELYRLHISGYDQMNLYRRRSAAKRLESAIRNRERRD